VLDFSKSGGGGGMAVVEVGDIGVSKKLMGSNTGIE
jgi:hypothetical protein